MMNRKDWHAKERKRVWEGDDRKVYKWMK